MPRRETNPHRTQHYERAGTVDFAFDDDSPNAADVIRSDAACAIPWVVDRFQSIQVFVDPVLTDRANEICAMVETVSATNRDLDALTQAVLRYAGGEGLSASIHETPQDDLSVGNVAIAFTLG